MFSSSTKRRRSSRFTGKQYNYTSVKVDVGPTLPSGKPYATYTNKISSNTPSLPSNTPISLPCSTPSLPPNTPSLTASPINASNSNLMPSLNLNAMPKFATSNSVLSHSALSNNNNGMQSRGQQRKQTQIREAINNYLDPLPSSKRMDAANRIISNIESSNIPINFDASNINSHLMPQFATNNSAHPNPQHPIANPQQQFERLKSILYTEFFAHDPRFNGQYAVQNERWRYTRSALLELGYMVNGSLNSGGIDNPLKNKRMHHFDVVVMGDICHEYLNSLSSEPSREDGEITYYGPFDFNAAKTMLGGVSVISKEATDGYQGFYHLDQITEIAYSTNNRTMTMRYLIKLSELRSNTNANGNKEEILVQYQ